VGHGNDLDRISLLPVEDYEWESVKMDATGPGDGSRPPVGGFAYPLNGRGHFLGKA
jgi:hypothetical protein